jgi:hypothetical protein
MPTPSIETFNPVVSLFVRMQNNRTSQTRVMKIKVSDVARWKNHNIPRLQLDHQSQFKEAELTTIPNPKWNDNTKKLVTPVTMAICGDTEINDYTSKGPCLQVFIQAEAVAVDLNVVKFLWNLMFHLQKMSVYLSAQ